MPRSPVWTSCGGGPSPTCAHREGGRVGVDISPTVSRAKGLFLTPECPLVPTEVGGRGAPFPQKVFACLHPH